MSLQQIKKELVGIRETLKPGMLLFMTLKRESISVRVVTSKKIRESNYLLKNNYFCRTLLQNMNRGTVFRIYPSGFFVDMLVLSQVSSELIVVPDGRRVLQGDTRIKRI